MINNLIQLKKIEIGPVQYGLKMFRNYNEVYSV